MWVVPYQDLTMDQVDAVQLSTQQNRVIVGGPGSGKTLVLLHRVKRFLDEGKVPSSGVLILTYTKVLKTYLNESLNQLGIDSDRVLNVDKWTYDLFTKYVKGPKPKSANGKPDFEAMRKQILDVWRLGKPEPLYELVVADEGQDLTSSALEMLKITSSHVTVALDSRQDIFGTATSVASACEILGVPRESASLLTAYRCTPMIVGLAAEFLPSERQRDEFRRSNLMEIHGIQKPEVCTYSNQDEQLDALVESLNNAIFQGHSCAILSPNIQKMHTLKNEIEKRGITCNIIDGTNNDAIAEMGSNPIIMNYHNAKGLTVDSVFLPYLEEKTFSASHLQNDAQRERLLFVGITRAIRWAWLGVPDEGYISIMDRLLKAAEATTATRNFTLKNAKTVKTSANQSKHKTENLKPTPNLADLI